MHVVCMNVNNDANQQKPFKVPLFCCGLDLFLLCLIEVSANYTAGVIRDVVTLLLTTSRYDFKQQPVFQ